MLARTETSFTATFGEPIMIFLCGWSTIRRAGGARRRTAKAERTPLEPSAGGSAQRSKVTPRSRLAFAVGLRGWPDSSAWAWYECPVSADDRRPGADRSPGDRAAEDVKATAARI